MRALAAILAVIVPLFGVTVTDEPRVGRTSTRRPLMEAALPVSLAVMVTFLPFWAEATTGNATTARAVIAKVRTRR